MWKNHKIIVLSIVFSLTFIFQSLAQHEGFLCDKGQQHYYHAQFDSALYYFQLAQETEPTNFLMAEKGIIQCLLKQGKLEQVELHLDEVLSQAVQNKYEFIILKSQLLFAKAQYRESLTTLDKLIISLREGGENSLLLAKTLNHKAKALFFLRDFGLSKQFNDDAIKVYRTSALEDFVLEGDLNNVNGLHCYANDDYDSALVFFRKALELKGKVILDNHPDIALLQQNIGLMYKNKSQYNKAIEYYNYALGSMKSAFGTKHLEIAKLLTNLGSALRYQGQLEEALKILLQALEIRKDLLGESNPKTIDVYEHIGAVLGSMGKYDEAILYFHDALVNRIKIFGPTHYFVLYSYYNLGDAYYLKENYQEAFNNFSAATAIGDLIYGEKSADQADCLNRLAISQLALGDTIKARENFKKAIVKNIPGDLWNGELNSVPGHIFFLRYAEFFYSITGLAKSYISAAKVDLELALQYVSVAESVLSEYKNSFTNQGDMVNISSDAKILSDIAIDTHYKLYEIDHDDNHLNRIFQHNELAKASALITSITDASAKNSSHIPDSLLQKERRFRVEKDSVKTLILQSLAKENDSTLLFRLNSSLFDLNRNHENLIADFEKKFPQYAAIKYGSKTIGVDKIQKKLNSFEDETILIEYHVSANQKLFVSIIGANQKELIVLDGAHLNQNIHKIRSAIADNNNDLFVDVSYSLYQQIFEPLESYLEHANHLVIIPDGILCYLPFEILISKNPQTASFKDQAYLLKTYAISYDLSATLYVNRDNWINNHPTSGLIAYSPIFDEKAERATMQYSGAVVRDGLHSLPGAIAEAKIVAELMGGEYVTDSLASETHFKREAPDYRILHLATHSIVDVNNPDYSRLIFSTNIDKEDGLLHAYELQNIEFNADLVTLSACNTGYGKILDGEGVLSLARSFTATGVPSIVMSSWFASDAPTTELMRNFYSNLKEGIPKHEALRNAKLEYLKNTKALGANPFHWGSFILIGNCEPLDGFNSGMNPIIILFISLLIAILVFLILKKRYQFSNRSRASS